MIRFGTACNRRLCVLRLALLIGLLAPVASAEVMTYFFEGEVTSVALNQNNVIPGLAVNDEFTGSVTFESSGWNNTNGTVQVNLNGVDLFFTGDSIYGGVQLNPSTNQYEIRIQGDTGGDITGSNFSAFNFGPDLEDANGSAGITDLFPTSINPNELEINIFTLGGSYIPTGDMLNAQGRVTYFSTNPIPEPQTFGLIALMGGLLARCIRC